LRRDRARDLRPWPQPQRHHHGRRRETTDQLDWLRAEVCNRVQGFLFSAAKPASEIAELLARFGARVSQAA